jgi:hypothetical protein
MGALLGFAYDRGAIVSTLPSVVSITGSAEPAVDGPSGIAAPDYRRRGAFGAELRLDRR